MKLGSYPSGLVLLAMPRGYTKAGKKLGGARKGTGPKPKPVKNVRVMLTVRQSTASALRKVPVRARVEVFSDALEHGVSEFLKGGVE